MEKLRQICEEIVEESFSDQDVREAWARITMNAPVVANAVYQAASPRFAQILSALTVALVKSRRR